MPVPTLLPTAWSPAWTFAALPLPVVTELRPAAYDYGARFQALEAAALGGRGASPVFGPTVAAADVYWRLYTETGRGSWLGPDAPATWRDTALAGSLLALNRLVDETVDRAPQIAAIRAAADAVVNPNLEIRTSPHGPPQASHRTGGRNARALQDAELNDGLAAPRRPGAAVGLDWTIRDDDAPADAPLLSWGAWMAVDGVAGANVRADLDLVHTAWAVTARERLIGGLSLVAAVRSAPRDVTPAAWSTGLALHPPRWRDGTLRLERRQSLDPVATDASWTLTLRVEHRTAAPRGVAYPGPTAPEPDAPPDRSSLQQTRGSGVPAAAAPPPRAGGRRGTGAR